MSTLADNDHRKTLVSALSDADIERVAGGATGVPDLSTDWDPEIGTDTLIVVDPS